MPCSLFQEFSLIAFSETTIHEIEEAFNDFVNRADIGIVLITQKV